MRRVCAWCKKEMGRTEDVAEKDSVTHGICAECEKLLEFEPIKTRDILNEFDNPVLVLNEEGRCIVSNTAASKVLEKELSSIESWLCGNVIGCVHAAEPGGCGKTEYCPDCVIRNTIEDTFKTGKIHLKVPAYNLIQTTKGVEKTKFFVSTEKRGNRVLFRLD